MSVSKPFRCFLPILCLLTACSTRSVMSDFQIPFETNPNQTLLYEEAIACYKKMAAAHPHVFRLQESGNTDSGQPLHVAVLSPEGIFDAQKLRAEGYTIWLINNGIHPGEPEGIDATVLFLRTLLRRNDLSDFLKKIVLVIVPVYNVDGCLNRNSYSRANQDGPEAYGFRGNARNYDLNRDFVKCDSRNARSFNALFQYWQPDVFVDNHTSNGADYQYVMTLIATQHNKLEAPLGAFLQTAMLPFLYQKMQEKGWEMTPYVDTKDETPDSGLVGFCDYGRYSTGYAAMWNTIGFMPETHMLKPFKDRLWSTYAFMETVLDFVRAQGPALREARAAAQERTRTKTTFVLDYQLDTSRYDDLMFKGYTAGYKPSEVSGLPRLYYDRSAPYTKKIPYYNYFQPAKQVEKPQAYVVPQAWEAVLERLRLNGVEMHALPEDTVLETETYFIRDFKTRNAWEGHYFHTDVQVELRKMQRHFFKGDFLIYTNQNANRYVVETLEPQGADSWFAWNFFESVLGQKEYFSAYVFEDLAAEYLKKNPALHAELENLKKNDPGFAQNPDAILDWVYRHSPWYEPTHRMLPVARLPKIKDK